MNTTQQPEALNLEEFRAKVTHAAREPLLARIAELEASESRTITQRDHCEEVIDRMADAVLGKDRHEWTSNYDYMDAAQEVEDRIAELEAQLSAIGAGGVEPLRKPASQQAVQAAVSVVDSLKSLIEAIQFTPLGVRQIHAMERARASLAATPAAGELATLQAGLQAAAPNAPLYDPREVAFSAQAAPQAVQAAVPVAGQSRFKGEKDWHWCSPEHVAMVAATPSEWQGYEARYLYAHAAPAHPAGGVPAQTTRDAVIQHLTNAGVLEHDGCGIFIASGDASELIDACMALSTHAHHEKGAAAQAVALLATGGQAQAVERIAIDMKQTAELLDLFGGEPTEFTVMQCNGHSGPGLYAYVTEYPEDGASYLGKTDCEAQPAPQAQAVCGIANKELRTEHAMQLVDAWYEAMKCGSVITRGEARQRIVEFVDALAATHPTQQGLDAARLGMLTAIEDSGEGLRYGLECLVNNGVNTFIVYDEQREEYLVDCWLKDPLAAIDAALAAQAKHGEAQQ